MAQRRLRSIEDSVRIPSRSTKEMETSARQRSGPESSPQQADNEATTRRNQDAHREVGL
jgi:hypothetical protein